MVDVVALRAQCYWGWGRTAVAAVRKLQREHDWEGEDIAAITGGGQHWAAVLHTAHPTTTEEAQFSVKWPLAAYLVDGEVGPDQILESRFGDVIINALVDKMTLVESEEFNELYLPSFEGGDEGYSPGRVVIHFEDGRTIDSGVVTESCRIEARGDEERLEQKFRWLTGYVLEQDRIAQLLEMLWHVEEISDVRELTALLQKR